jgi:precorrin-8X/cobalt-precorrin-8 methylmutase
VHVSSNFKNLNYYGKYMNDDRIHLSPDEIEKASFALIDSEVSEPRPFQGEQWQIVRRMIHTTADFELLSLIAFHPAAVQTGIAALQSGCLIITDTEMARIGISARRLKPLGCQVACYINDPAVVNKAPAEGITRSAAAVEHAVSRLTGAIYVVGNAPTALLRLLEHIKENRCKPALVVGMPVGFVNAAESKKMLMEQGSVPFITIRGRKGGSAVAASAVNQLAELALKQEELHHA